MTKKLENLFNLPDLEDPTPAEELENIEYNKSVIREVDAAIDKIDAALPTVHDLEAADKEMDDLAQLAQDKFNDLMDLGMNVEPRYSGVIFQTAGTLLGHAITAKQAKLDKKLRMVQLQLSKARLDQQAAKANGDNPPPIEGQGMILDRNELLKTILQKNDKKE